MKIQFIGFFLASLFAVGCATSHPIKNISKSAITSAADIKDVEKNIQIGVKSVGWRIDESKPGEIIASIQVRKHHAVVSIIYDKTSYSIQYKDSSNLDYNPTNGSIHRSYNKWIVNLDRAIQQRF